MPVTYERCPDEVEKLCSKMRDKYHGELTTAGVCIDLIFAAAERNEAGAIEANPVTVGGYARAAKIKICTLKERVKGAKDCEIVIDAGRWADSTPDQRAAILDQQLQRLELRKDDKNIVQTDDVSRPKLKLRRFDHCFQWFDSCAERHGDAAIEVEEAKAFADAQGQHYFGWSSPPPRVVESAMLPNVLNQQAADTAKAELSGAGIADTAASDEASKKAAAALYGSKPNGKGNGRGKKAKQLPDAGAEAVAAAAPEAQSHGEAWAAAQRPAMA